MPTPTALFFSVEWHIGLGSDGLAEMWGAHLTVEGVLNTRLQHFTEPEVKTGVGVSGGGLRVEKY